MAKFILQHLLDKAGLSDKILIDSAGCVTEGGEPLGRRTSLTLKENNIPIGEHISKPFTAREYKNFQCVVALDRKTLYTIKENFGDPDKKIRMLKDSEGKDISVDDPGFKGEHSKAYAKIFQGCEFLLKELLDK